METRQSWLKQKKAACCTICCKTAAQRTEADAARQVGIVKETRTAAEAAYRSLVDTVNALAMINGDAEYATFIDHVNAMIETAESHFEGTGDTGEEGGRGKTRRTLIKPESNKD